MSARHKIHPCMTYLKLLNLYFGPLVINDFGALVCAHGSKGQKLKRGFYSSFCLPSAVRPSVRPKKTFPDFAPVLPPTFDLGPIQWGQSYTDFYTLGQICEVFYDRSVCRWEGVGRRRGGVGWRTTDRRKL